MHNTGLIKLFLRNAVCKLFFISMAFGDEAEFFAKNGYLGPISFLSQTEAESVCADLRTASPPPQTPEHYWCKNRLFLNPAVIAISKSEQLLSQIQSLLGPNILLWSAELVRRAAGVMHRWHVDIEHTKWDGLTIWLPLMGVSSKSTIRFIPGSHTYPLIPQSLEDVNLKNDQEVLAAARKIDPEATIISIEMQPGQFVLFAGKMWHSTINETVLTREALLLQYCRPDADVRIPLNHGLPTRWSDIKPWVIQVTGEDLCGINLFHP